MYTIKYEAIQDEDGILIPIVETVMMNDSFGDSIGIDKETNSLWVSNYFHTDDFNMDPELDDFLRSYFKTYSSVKGFIRRNVD
jgi:hypothetical protein